MAILGLNDSLPWRAANVCFRHQRDFNYLEARHLWEDARVDADGIRLAGMHYRALILEEDPPDQAKPAIDVLTKAGRVVRWRKMPDSQLIEAIDRLVTPDVRVSPDAPGLRVRHVQKGGTDYYLLFNEGSEDLALRLNVSAKGGRVLLDPTADGHETVPADRPVRLPKHALRVLAVNASY